MYVKNVNTARYTRISSYVYSEKMFAIRKNIHVSLWRGHFQKAIMTFRQQTICYATLNKQNTCNFCIPIEII